jgi:hypothetical protein
LDRKLYSGLVEPYEDLDRSSRRRRAPQSDKADTQNTRQRLTPKPVKKTTNVTLPKLQKSAPKTKATTSLASKPKPTSKVPPKDIAFVTSCGDESDSSELNNLDVDDAFVYPVSLPGGSNGRGFGQSHEVARSKLPTSKEIRRDTCENESLQQETLNEESNNHPKLGNRSPGTSRKRPAARDGKVSLDKVYKKHKEQAAEFISEVVSNMQVAESPGTPPLSVATPLSARLKNQHRENFNLLLCDLFEECELKETDVLTQVNALAKRRGLSDSNSFFESSQVDAYINCLCDEDKIMKTDGVIYLI